MIYSGIIKYEDADIAFQFDELKLTLYPTYDLFNKITMYQIENASCCTCEKKPISDGYLKGKVNGQSQIIHFFFDPMGYGTSIKNFIECEITIYVHKFTKYNCDFPFPVKNVSLQFESQQIHKYLGLVPKYEISHDMSQGICGTISCNTETTKYVSRGIMAGTELSIFPAFKCSWSETSFKFFPELFIQISEIKDEKHLLSIYDAIRKFIKYTSMRADIEPDSFFIHIGEKIEGEICSIKTIKCDKEKEDCNSIYRGFVPWQILHRHAINILEKIYLNDWYLDNLPSNKNERIVVSDITISKDAAAFENEFSKCFPQGLPTHSEKRILAETEVEKEIVPLFEAAQGRKKKIYKGFISHIRNDALADKIEYCLNEYEVCIEWLKTKIAKELSNEEIADKCVSIRNDIDHGNKKINLDNDIAIAYIILRGLIYAMQLKRIGYETEEIAASVKNLFYIKGLAP
ncbi:HEPN domain-containing protein [Ruminococcus sp.]